NIKNGIFNVKIDFKVNNELDELLLGFNDMAQKLADDQVKMNSYIDKITMLNEYNETIINSLKVGILIINSEFKIEKVNNYFLKNFHFKTENIVQKSIKKLNIAIINQEILKNIEKIIRKKKKFQNIIQRTTHNKIYEMKTYPLYNKKNDQNNRTSCILIIEDISKKMEYEEKFSKQKNYHQLACYQLVLLMK
ncbi:MAG: PAS domain-containing protein, partial [Spirochaetes bacterium]|nr:PAS domain-containing protein [Spirochaetota bacterium]